LRNSSGITHLRNASAGGDNIQIACCLVRVHVVGRKNLAAHGISAYWPGRNLDDDISRTCMKRCTAFLNISYLALSTPIAGTGARLKSTVQF
jgi:hypothetical protein